MRRRLDVLIGLVAVGLALSLVVLTVLIFRQTFVDSVDVDLRTGPVGNALQVGSDVKVRGVPVGRVEKITATEDGAVLKLAIEPDEAGEIPDTSVARLLPKTLFGERFVALLTPTTGGGSPVADGDVLEQDTSQQSVELEDLFDDLLPLLTAVQPEKLSAMLGELATTLRGQGTEIGDTAVIAASYLGKLNPLVPQIADDFEALGQVANDYADATPDLLSALDNLTTSSATLVDDQQNLQATLSRVTGSSNAGTGFVSANQDNIIVLSAESRRALAAVRPFADTFPCVFSSLRAFIPKMDAALGAGTSYPGLQADVTVVAARGGYVAGQKRPELKTKGKASCPTNTPAKGADQLDQSGPVALGLSEPNSPRENRVLAELLAPSRGLNPDDFPAWGSLLLGPVMRGSELELR